MMRIVAEEEPPELFAQIVQFIDIGGAVGIPQIVPLLVLNVRPGGKAGVISHDVMTPGPVKVGASGKSPLAVLLVRVRFSGE
jgi:hypothetical protein